MARSAERGIAPGEPMRITPPWHDVNNLGLQILTSQSKDIEILAWLAEAQVRLRGFEGLRDVFAATSTLLENTGTICTPSVTTMSLRNSLHLRGSTE